MTEKEKLIERVAGEIERYFLLHPAAADTAEGIAKWWLTRQRYLEAVEIVEAALDRLIRKRRVTKKANNYGINVYRYKPLKKPGDH